MNLLLVSNFIIDDQALAIDIAASMINKTEELSNQNNETTLNINNETKINLDWKNFKNTKPQNDKITKFINNQQIIIFNSKTKENLSQNLISLFVKYNKPTWLVLGNLSEISSAMQQGLLRFIEEPPQNLNIIISTRSKTDVLTTILSRCQMKHIPSFIGFDYIDREKNDDLTSVLQAPKDFIQNLLQNKLINTPEFKNISRDGLETWLWQLEYITSEVIIKNGSSERLKRIFTNIIEAKKLNQANVLNRLVWAQLFL